MEVADEDTQRKDPNPHTPCPQQNMSSECHGLKGHVGLGRSGSHAISSPGGTSEGLMVAAK